MIDIHCHLLPNVDDGPTTHEDAMKMVDMAYADGIRCAVVTPHRNHPFDFKTELPIEAIYKQFRSEVVKKYPDFGVVLGAELFIASNYMQILTEKPYDFTIANTNYVLIEFPRNISIREMHNVIHELIIRGYRPIIAHVEMYPALMKNIDHMRSVRNDGAYLQITGSSLLGKQGSEIAAFLRKMVRVGLVDFVASDGHLPNKRRPLLNDAFKAVRALIGDKEAERIFHQNPKLMISDRHIPQPTFTLKTGGTKIVKLNFIAASFAVLLISSITLFSLLNRDDALSKFNPEKTPENIIAALTESEETTSAGEGETTVDSTSEGSTTMTTEVEITTEVESVPTQQEIEATYYEALNILRADYIAKLDAIVANIKVAQQSISDDEQRKSIIDAYIAEISALENQSDNTVYDMLYQMQNELEEHDYDVSTVQAMRDEYHQTKADKQNEYLKELGL